MPLQLAVPLLIVAVSAAFAVPAGAAATVPNNFQDLPVRTTGLNQPSDFAFLPDGRILLVERTSGNVRAIDGWQFVATNPIGTVDSVNVAGGERGLLGIAVDPSWPAKPYVYVHYTALGGNVRIERYTITGDLTNTTTGDLALDTTSAYVVLETPDNSPLHQGGSLEFGPDSMLFISIGDDGAACDAQDINVLKGKILRIDVSGLPAGPGGPPALPTITAWDNPFAANVIPEARLVYAYGLRNPYSMEVDPVSGTVYVADVGAFSYEEMNVADSAGVNFGWPFREGPVRHGLICPSVTDTSVMVDPASAYPNGGGASIITAGAYHAPAGASNAWPTNPYDGSLFYSDFSQAFMRRTVRVGDQWVDGDPVPGQPNGDDWAVNAWSIADYEIGPDGSLYYLQMWTNFHGESDTGQLRKIAYSATLSVPPSDARFRLSAYPSPAADHVTFSVVLEDPADVRLDVLDATGRRVRTIERGRALAPGRHAFEWSGLDASGRPVAPGVYLARWMIDGRALVKRVVRLR